MQRHVRVLPPRDNIVICPAGVREAGMSQMSLLVVDSSSFLVPGDWFWVFSSRKRRNRWQVVGQGGVFFETPRVYRILSRGRFSDCSDKSIAAIGDWVSAAILAI